ncbi:MAG: T9SS type A sorting domain-containing protein [Chlorobi bacterium]|nr:T9SS type A sorting domain-containing protein [Chlorobiota bacterium]
MKTKTLLSIILIFCTFNFFGQIINVPAGFTTIQAGINAAADGDTVLIADGTYYENISFKGKAITVASQYLVDGDTTHIWNTVIDGSLPSEEDTASVVRFINGEDTTSILYGLTIQGGTGTLTSVYGGIQMGGGIFCLHSGAKIIKNRIINNSITHEFIAAGAGIGSFVNSQEKWLVAEDNVIMNNTSHATGSPGWRSAAGGGIYAHSNSRVINNVIQFNECYSTYAADGAGVEFESPQAPGTQKTVYFNNNIVQFNIADGVNLAFGGGVSNYYTKMFIRENIISNNTLISDTLCFGAGISILGWENLGDEVLITNNEFASNKMTGDGNMWGTGISLTNMDNSVVIRDNSFLSNSGSESENSSGTVSIYFYTDTFSGTDSKIIIDRNIFSANYAEFGGAIRALNSFNFSITNNFFTGNNAREGGAIYLDQISQKKGNQNTASEDTRPELVNNTFVFNNSVEDGGAIKNNYSSYPVITFNNIFWGNDAGTFGNDIANTGMVNMLIAYSIIDTVNIFGDWSGEWNVNEDPMFIEDSLHIEFGSPCIDNGAEMVMFEDSAYYIPETDIDGEGRLLGENVDIGADEFLTVGITPVLTGTKDIIEIYPNPFSYQTNIRFDLEERSYCVLKVYNSLGAEVTSLLKTNLGKGTHTLTWPDKDLPDGIYHFILITQKSTYSVKGVYLR